ncbi:hypothetical protein NHQ30_004786 [Ciborinia camelliae]|nr:hypothetical protein NHQ30_004786 [Ciborinia camelliae]
MSDSEMDEDLKRAIALSLDQTSSPVPTREKNLIDLTISDDDDDLDAPVTTHFKFSQHDSVQSTSTEANNDTSSHLSNQPSSTILNSLNRKQMEEERMARSQQRSKAPDVISKKRKLDEEVNSLNRKQMEEERMARAQQRSKAPDVISKKRKAPPSSPTSSLREGHQPKVSRPELVLRKETDKGHRERSTDRNSTGKGTNHALDDSLAESNPKTGIRTSDNTGKVPRDAKPEGDISGTGVQFPHGVVKKTWAYGFPREDDIKIEEVLQRSTLEHAVLSAFQIEPDWVISKLLPTTKVIWVLQAKTEAEKLNYKSSAPEIFRFCFPSMEGNVNCMHSKLQLLAHPTHLRLVIPSANLTPYDWGERGGIMENVVFLIDLPRLPNGERASDGQLTPFAKELLHFLGAMGLPSRTLESFRSFDYSNTNHLALVHSIGGSHSGTELQRTGYPGLGRSTASIGNLDDRFLRTIYLASQGDNGYKEYKWRTEKPAGSKTESVMEKQLSEEIERRFRAAGTICFRSKWYDASSFPKNLMRECQSRRKGLLMHNKMLFVRSQKSQQSPRPIAWAYVGSANLSESAWQVFSVFT